MELNFEAILILLCNLNLLFETSKFISTNLLSSNIICIILKSMINT